MSEARPTRHAEPATEHRELVRIAIAGAVAASAIGFIVADLDSTVMAACVRLAAAVSLVMISHWLVERRLARRLDQIEKRLERAGYWRVYADVLNDLSGIDGESSGDISTERAPRR